MVLHTSFLVLTLLLVTSLAKRNYEVIMKNAELITANPAFYSDETDVEVDKIDDNTDAVNAVLDLLQDLPSETAIHVESFELQGNTWVKGSVQINDTWCKFIKSDPYFMEGIIQQSNYPKECPIKAMKFEVKNFTIDEENLPEQVPGDDWRFVFKQLDGDTELIEFQFDAHIKRN